MAGESKTTTDHSEIKKWAEKRGGRPATVKSTEDPSGAGILRIDFPGYGGEEELEEIDWETFFQKFDNSNLAFLYQEETAEGQLSRFNKFIRRAA